MFKVSFSKVIFFGKKSSFRFTNHFKNVYSPSFTSSALGSLNHNSHERISRESSQFTGSLLCQTEFSESYSCREIIVLH